MPQASFIIPVLNEADGIAPLLEGLRAAFPDAELVVVDGGSDDGTARLALARCDQLLRSEPGRARQMNLGAAAANGDYYFFLHADCFPSVTAEQLESVLGESPAWGFCRVRLGSPEWPFTVISWFMNWRSRLTRVATGDQMQFVRSDIFEQTGGFDQIPLMEDVAYSKRLRQIAPPRVIGQVIQVAARRWQERGIARTVLVMWGLRLAYFLGVSPARLWRVYYGR